MNALDIRTIKRLADIEAATTSRALSLIELSQTCHMNDTSAGEYLRHLVATGQMHIAAWRENSPGRKVALYTWGAGRNHPKPKPRTKVATERARMKRIKADPDAYDHFLSYHRARYAAKRAVKRPQSWLSALGAI